MTRFANDNGAIDSIRRLVEDAEKYQNDLERFIALHTPDVVLVNISGRRVLGRDALRQAMKAALETPLASVYTSQEMEDVRFIRPDVAVVSCRKQVSDEREVQADDQPAFPLTGGLTYVVVQEPDGAWRIAVAQTTPVAYP